MTPEELKQFERERDKDRAGIGALDIEEYFETMEAEEIAEIEQTVLTAQGEMAYNLICPSSKRAIDEAAKLGMDVVFPKDNQLQIDIDNDESYALYEGVRDVIDHHYGIIQEEVHASKSGGERRHLTITLARDIENMERIALQASLGSDRKRELLSIIQEVNGDDHPVLFLELKGSPNAPKQLTAGQN